MTEIKSPVQSPSQTKAEAPAAKPAAQPPATEKAQSPEGETTPQRDQEQKPIDADAQAAVIEAAVSGISGKEKPAEALKKVTLIDLLTKKFKGTAGKEKVTGMELKIDEDTLQQIDAACAGDAYEAKVLVCDGRIALIQKELQRLTMSKTPGTKETEQIKKLTDALTAQQEKRSEFIKAAGKEFPNQITEMANSLIGQSPSEADKRLAEADPIDFINKKLTNLWKDKGKQETVLNMIEDEKKKKEMQEILMNIKSGKDTERNKSLLLGFGIPGVLMYLIINMSKGELSGGQNR